MERSCTHRTRAVLLAGLVTIAASCGAGNSDAGGSKTTTTKPAAAKTATTAKATTTTTEVPKADPATKAEAASRVYAEEDFPEGWTVAVKALPYDTKGVKVDDCINPEGGPLSEVPLGAAVGGPTMRAPDVDYFITSWAATFEDEAKATAFAEQVATPEHATCMAETLEAGSGKGRKDFSVKVTSAPPAERGVGQDHRVASDSYELREGDQVTSIVYIDTFQIGPTVVTVNSELGPMTQEQSDAASAVEEELRGRKFA